MAGISFDREETPGLISIVIPTYRKERFIGETLDSVSSQTYPNWEVIVVEDASFGATQRIVAEFAQRHPDRRVDYSRNDKNRGAAHSRNVAFAKSAGQFVALLDSDDRWFPDHLRRSVLALSDADIDIVYSSVVMIEDATDWLMGVWGPKRHDLKDFPHGLYRENFISPSATVLRRRVIGEIGAWNTSLRYCEDLDYWLRCIEAGMQFRHLGGCHCLYRKNHDGATTQQACGTREEFAEIVERFTNMPGVWPRTRRKLVAKAYVRAAHAHWTVDPAEDPSADPARAAQLLYKAWRLRPKRINYLFNAIACSGANALGLRARRVAEPAQSAPQRKAA